MAIMALGIVAWGIVYNVSLRFMAVGNKSQGVIWHWVLCHVGAFGIRYYVTIGIIAVCIVKFGKMA